MNPPRIAPIGELAAADSRGAPKAVEVAAAGLGPALYQAVPQYLPADAARARQPPGGRRGAALRVRVSDQLGGCQYPAEHPACRYLRSICDVDIRVIDDLITGDNHSTTITLAYAQAVQAAGSAMLDTCFFFLMSDYLMADGSLANASCSDHGGSAAACWPAISRSSRKRPVRVVRRDDSTVPVRQSCCAPRELMQWALPHLHPVTAGNTVNFPLVTASQANRLFWRVDENTLLGRFYLMHMICIRPEVTDFVVGSSCDYSFIPEMCPSGKVDVITDSDDYLVVEMQPGDHEGEFLRLGSEGLRWRSPARSASGRRKRHRDNVRHSAGLSCRRTSAVFARHHDAVGRIHRRDRIFRSTLCHRICTATIRYWVGAFIAHRLSVSRKLGRRIKTGADLSRVWTQGALESAVARRAFSAARPTFVLASALARFRDLESGIAKVLAAPSRRLLDRFQGAFPVRRMA